MLSSICLIESLPSNHRILYVETMTNHFRRLYNTVATKVESIYLLEAIYINFLNWKNTVDLPSLHKLSGKSQINAQNLKKTDVFIFLLKLYIFPYIFLIFRFGKVTPLVNKEEFQWPIFSSHDFFCRIPTLTVFRPARKKRPIYTGSYTGHAGLFARLSLWPSWRKGKTGFISFFFLQRWDK